MPPDFLEAAEARERAARLARPVTEKLRKAIEKEVLEQLAAGVPEEEILARVSSKYGIRPRKRG